MKIWGGGEEVLMPNVTMTIDDELLKKAKKIAIDRNSTISELFREYLTDLTRREDLHREYVADELDRLFAASSASSYGISIPRDDLHER